MTKISQTNSTSAATSLDGWLLSAVIGLLMIGLIMVASASIAKAQFYTGFGLYFFTKQFIFAILAIMAIGFMLFVPTKTWQKLGPVWFLIGMFLLLLVLVPGIGRTVNGSQRWIALGPIAIQASEAVKWCAVMYLGDYLVRHQESARTTFVGLIKPLFVLALFAVLLLLEPDFGATLVIFATALGMMFMAGARLRWFYLFVIVAIAAAGLLVLVAPYRMERFIGFLSPWKDQVGAGYQLVQSLIAVGHAGLWGMGLGDSLQKLFYLPEAHTDFILAVTAEELGFIGVLFILTLFAILTWRGLKIAKTAQLAGQLFDAYAAYGVTFWLMVQVIINCGANIGLLPTKGIALPLISYGGSSLVIDCIAIGLLFRIDLQNKFSALGAR